MADKHPADALADWIETLIPLYHEKRQAAAQLRRVPELEAERDRHLVEHAQCMADMDGEIDRLRAEVEALRADAERYRWLRSVPSGFEAQRIVNDTPHRMDAAIDAARKPPRDGLTQQPGANHVQMHQDPHADPHGKAL